MSQIDMLQGYNTAVAMKVPVAAAATSNITLSGAQTVGGVATDGKRILAVAQTTASENGIWIGDDDGAWTRAGDFDGAGDVTQGTLVQDYNTGTIYRVTNSGTITPGSTSLTFDTLVLGGLGALSAAAARQALGLPGALTQGRFIMPRTDATDGWAAVQFPLENPVNVSLAGARDVSDNYTIAFKTAAGTDATDNDPGIIPFRSSTLSNGGYSPQILDAASSLQLPSGSAFGVANNEVMRLWVLAGYTGSAIVPIVVNCRRSGTGKTAKSIMRLGLSQVVSTTAVGAGALLSHTFYSQSAHSNIPARVIGYIEWTANKLATAGVFASDHDRIVLHHKDIPLPGLPVNSFYADDGAAQTSTIDVPEDNTSLQYGEVTNLGMDIAMTHVSLCNVLQFDAFINAGVSAASSVVLAIHQGGTGNALVVGDGDSSGTNGMTQVAVRHRMLVPSEGSVTYNLGAGPVNTSATLTVNGSGGSGLFNGALISSFLIEELQG